LKHEELSKTDIVRPYNMLLIINTTHPFSKKTDAKSSVLVGPEPREFF
jgi:hypothetical protein